MLDNLMNARFFGLIHRVRLPSGRQTAAVGCLGLEAAAGRLLSGWFWAPGPATTNHQPNTVIINGETTFWSAMLIQKMSLASSGILDSFSFFKILTLSMVACTCTSFLLVLVVDRR